MLDVEFCHDDLLTFRFSYRRRASHHDTAPVLNGPQLVLSMGRNTTARTRDKLDLEIACGRTDSIRIQNGLILRHLTSYKTVLGL
uniref:Uncharacterized protein n=1 Tax=Timema monikensis TaxID=170555 RepID=A0A7R9HV87_9NEOP|nr:unnamed protein product [Timema monikensis]